MATPRPEILKLSDLDPDAFYSPEFLAPIVGFTNWEIRDYCRRSGINTRLAKNRIMLDVDDARRLLRWVKAGAPGANDSGGDNPFK